MGREKGGRSRSEAVLGETSSCRAWCVVTVGSELESITLGHPLLDEYLGFVAVRARPNTWLAVASDLKVFFGVVAKEPAGVTRRMRSRSWPFSARRAAASGGPAGGRGARGWRRDDRAPAVDRAWAVRLPTRPGLTPA